MATPRPEVAEREISSPTVTRTVPGCLLHDRSEQTSSALAALSMLAKGTSMSEVRSNYMAELDHWIEQTVIQPLYSAWQAGEDGDAQHARKGEMNTTQLVKGAIRPKLSDSYDNGRAAG